jgi:hypothetical protein
MNQTNARPWADAPQKPAGSTAPAEFLLLFHGHWDEGKPTAEVEAILRNVEGWFDNLDAQGRIKGGQALGTRRKVLAPPGKTSDGPFAESKEVVGGYLLLTARDFEEAVALAENCPTIQHGVTVEVRPISPVCPVIERLRLQREEDARRSAATAAACAA